MNSNHILLMEGVLADRQRLQSCLSGENYRLSAAANAAEARRLLKRPSLFDLVILNIKTSGLPAHEVCSALRKDFLPCELPILLIATKGCEKQRMEALSRGANDYLLLPFRPGELIARVKTQLNLRQFHTAANKFVPREFIRALGKENITQVELGDFIQREVSVLFTDIRNYTALSEQMSPEQNFRFINAYESRMAPLIRRHQGFVNQFLGDGIMALFPEAPEGALAAAIAMQRQLQRYNERRKKKSRTPLRVGMGLHAGPLIMGIIGDDHRMQAATVADTVNTASHIEGLSKLFGANILLSESQLSSIWKKADYHFRPLGYFKMKGRIALTKVYECFDGDPPGLFEKKLQSRPLFDKGIRLLGEKKHAEASRFFKEALTVFPEDTAARFFLERTTGSAILLPFPAPSK